MSGFGSSPGPTNSPPIYSGLQVSTSQYNMPITIFWGQRRVGINAIWFNNFRKHKQKAKGKGGGGKGGESYTYTAAVAAAMCEGPIDGTANIWTNGSTTTVTSAPALLLTVFPGTADQAPWTFAATRYPAEARAYPYTAYIGAPSMDLGASATVPDLSIETIRSAGFSYTHSATGWTDPTTGYTTPAIDVLLSDVIKDLLTNPQYGNYMAPGDIGSITQYAAYQRAQGLFFSPLITSQVKVTELLNRWATLSNSWIYWSGTQLEFVPLGDAAITANGATYTPQIDVAYDLGPDDFIVSDRNEPPVKISRRDPADCYNRTSLSFCDRTKGYVSNPVEYKDQTLIDTPGIGQRDSSAVQADDICDPAVAEAVVQLIGKRAAYIRNTYSFRTSHRFARCLPGTILTLTDPNHGFDKVRVRVKRIRRDERRKYEFECEEFPGTVGVYVPALATVDAWLPTVPNQYVLPGNVNTPAIAEPDSRFTGGDARIIIAASGGINWGGCTVYLSFDGTSYSLVGQITSPASQGVLTAGLASSAGPNPDTTHTLSVDCTQSEAPLVPVTHDDADQLRSLALVAAQPTPSGGAAIVPTNGELLAFGEVTATGTYSADLEYLQRGAYGSAAGTHSTGEQFTVINPLGNDGTSISYALPAGYIGQTLYLKFSSFNLFGLSSEDLSTVVEYRYTPTGAGFGTGAGGIPAVPAGLAGSSGAGNNNVSWSANPVADRVLSYSLYRASGAGASFGSASLIWSGNALSHTDQGLPGTTAYTYFVIATNVVGSSGPSAGFDLVLDTSAPSPSDWTLTPIALGNGGANTPALLIEGTAAAYATEWVVEVRTVDGILNEDGTPVLNEDGAPILGDGDSGAWMADTVQPAYATTRTITNGIANDGIYEVAISYRQGQQVGDRLVLGPVVAGSLAVARSAHEIRSQTVPFPVSSNDTSISILAFVATLDDSRTATLPAGTVSGLSSSISYGVFWQMGPASYVVTPYPSLAEWASSDNVFLRWQTTSAGGVYPPGDPAPPGDGGEGTNCVTDDTQIQVGEGITRQARDIAPGDIILTRHEKTLEWGYYPVTAISFATEPVMRAEGYPRATPGHRFLIGNRWVRMDEIGTADGEAMVAKITVAEAHTYVSAGVLSHNIKQN